MTKNIKYLEVYRRFESVLKADGKYFTVKDYEDALESDKSKQNKLRMCRMIRNYIEHENQTFLEATDEMIDFLEKETISIDESETPVKKKMVSVKNAIKDTDLIVVAADYMTKKKYDTIPIFDKTDFSVGVLTYESIVKYIASGDFSKAKKTSVIVAKHKFGFVKEDMPMKEVRKWLNGEKVFLVLNESKKVVGWII